MSDRPMRLGIVGCGAVAELFHLPAAAGMESVNVTLLVDKDLERARQLAEQFSVERVTDDVSELGDHADAAVVALPHHLHAPISIDLLQSGVHVLVEKPMALTGAECAAMVRASEEGGAVLAVGMMRRLLPATRWAKSALENGDLGDIESFDFRDGSVSTWPIATTAGLRPETAGGGVLINNGAHTVDLLLWWLGAVTSREYRDDSHRGVEANCELRLTLASGATGLLELSKTRQLRNTAIVRGERGELEIGLHSNHLAANPKRLLAREYGGIRGDQLPEESMRDSYSNLFRGQLEALRSCVDQGRPLPVGPVEAARSIELIERCYAERQPLESPWLTTGGGSAAIVGGNSAAFGGQRVLVTGATGCIGGRLVEKLHLEYGTAPRVLVRNLARAHHIARFPLDVVVAEIDDPDGIDRAVSGCHTVFHCAHNFADPPQNLAAASLLAAACVRHDVERLVHVSTHAVYNPGGDGLIDESSPPRDPGWAYADNKLAIEKELFRQVDGAGLRVVVLQPTVVYGPYSNWTKGPVTWLTGQRLVLPDDGSGVCHPVYVDDVVDALLSAAMREEAVGERMLIAGPAPVTWREFYGAYESMLGVRSVICVPASKIENMIDDNEAEVDSTLRRLRRDPAGTIAGMGRSRLPPLKWLYRSARAIVPDSWRERTKAAVPAPLLLPDRSRLASYRSRRAVSLAKARRNLDYEPAHDFSRGMELTSRYVRWANLA